MNRTAFPRTARYDPEWVRRNSLGENSVAQAESLAEQVPLDAETRLLDLGCGRAATSIFFAKEFGAQVWAIDRASSSAENLRRIREAGCEERVFPIRADARDLPFPEDFFDAAVAIDSYHYFGTDDRYLGDLARFVRRGGWLGIADVALSREISRPEDAPEFLRGTFAAHWSFVHSIDWWKAFWERTGVVEAISARRLPESRALLLEYAREAAAAGRRDEIARAAELDTGEWILLFTLVARKR